MSVCLCFCDCVLVQYIWFMRTQMCIMTWVLQHKHGLRGLHFLCPCKPKRLKNHNKQCFLERECRHTFSSFCCNPELSSMIHTIKHTITLTVNTHTHTRTHTHSSSGGLIKIYFQSQFWLPVITKA